MGLSIINQQQQQQQQQQRFQQQERRRISVTAEDCAVSSTLSSTTPSSSFDALHNTAPPNLLIGSSSSKEGVGVNLRKRKDTTTPLQPQLATCNSALLTGIFEDIAKQSEILVTEQQQQQSPQKKARVLSRSISRCAKSFKNLSDCLTANNNEQQQHHLFERQDSLSFQLNCVSDSNTTTSNMDTGKIAFPHLPATVSNSSCYSTTTSTTTNINNKLTQRLSQPSLDTFEKNNNNLPSNEAYGWFVSMEQDDHHDHSATAIEQVHKSNSSSSLAFSAMTAPKQSNQAHDAQVEWAQAADTVDDVLGDFF